MSIDLGMLEKFYVVAEEGSISGAAGILKTTQSSLSKQINHFEYQLKTKLLNRSYKGVSLTLSGEDLFEHAKRVIQLNNNYSRIFTEDDNKIIGKLKVIAYPYLGAQWLLECVDDFLEVHPEINLMVEVDSENINPVNQDISLGSFIPYQSHLIQRELFCDYNLIYTSEKYLKKFGIPERAKDLDNHRIIGYMGKQSYSPNRSINTLVNLELSPYQLPRKPYLEVGCLEGMIKAVLKGYGIAELPVFAANQFPELIQILPDVKGSNVPIYFIYKENRKNSKKIQAFYNYLLEKSDVHRRELILY